MKPIRSNSLRALSVTLAAALVTLSLGTVGGGVAWAGALDALTNKDTSSGLRAALSQGIDVAVAQLGALYDQYAGKAASMGLLKPENANLNDYVAAKALDGLFSRMADEEKAIRKDPLGQTSSLIRKVFSAATH